MKNEIQVAIVGAQFMGRAHSNAYFDVNSAFDLPRKPVLALACDRAGEPVLEKFARRYGWKQTTSDWQAIIADKDIELVDICTPNASHMPIAIAAAKAGKNVICEKPLAMNADEAWQMYRAAEDNGVVHMCAFNYRRVPAIGLAKQMIEQGKLGKIHHFNAVYYQDWLVDPQFPFVWRHDLKEAGSGASGDMHAHIVDLARHLCGEVEAVVGIEKIFVKERPLSTGSGFGTVTADDASSFFARFQNGALGSFQVSRFATGRKNFLRLEIFGSEGALVWNLERLNELDYYDRSEPQAQQGFRNIVVTESVHPYINAWWPAGHIIGWEHTFIHEVRDMLMAIDGDRKVTPSFYDGWRCQQVLDAAAQSARENRWVDIQVGE